SATSVSAFIPFAMASRSCWKRKPRSSNSETCGWQRFPQRYEWVFCLPIRLRLRPAVSRGWKSPSFPEIKPTRRDAKSISPPNLRKILQLWNFVHLTFVVERPSKGAFREGCQQLLRHQRVEFIQKLGKMAAAASG